MESQILKAAATYVTGLLQQGLTKDHRYHSVAHTTSTRDTALKIGQTYRLTGEELEVLELAALFHDTGFTQTYNGHEDVSKVIAADFLKKEDYPPEKIKQIQDLIEVTKLGVEPKTLLQKILKDSDFNTLDGTYAEKSAALRHEWKVFNGVEMDERGWLENNMQFWEGHQFHTGEGLAMFGEEKRKTQKKINKQLEKGEIAKPIKPIKIDEEATDFPISSSKSAQLMFKTTLRNHVDLTNIADNKANIMLSINSLLITLSISTLAANYEKIVLLHLTLPIITLYTTCILSIVYATLATRPVKMPGYTDISKIGKGTTNLFFFGNFYKMSIGEYKEGLKIVLADDKELDDTIVNDLFWLGKALGQKFTMLRTCYSIFMVGMIVTVLTFAVVFLIGK